MPGLIGGLIRSDLKERVFFGDLFDQFRPVDRNLEFPGGLVPGPENFLAEPRFKGQAAAQRNHAWLCHDMFFLLVVEDRVGEFALFEDEDAQAFFLGMTRRTQSRGPRSDDQQIINHKVIPTGGVYSHTSSGTRGALRKSGLIPIIAG